ncbi:MAG: hypothetical protein HY744_29985 [Deltaproteobacteria bacterium]|nr:hypothetical protein [Deltaproteobacteria bacterium]
MRSSLRAALGLASIIAAALCLGVACGSTGETGTPSSSGAPGGGTAVGGAAGAAGGGGEAGAASSSGGPASDDDGDGYSEIQGDCNDANADIHPGAVEICDDGSDNNCNGVKDENEPDGDGDGFGPCQGDCNEADANISPAAEELPGDGIDNNCDGIVDGDYDGDGYSVEGGDCNDQDPSINPGTKEDCLDGIDNDCNGFKDKEEPDGDGDGLGPCAGDCNDADPTVNPKAAELPGDGIDNNCDNLVDEDIDGDGWTEKNGDCDDKNPAINPGVLEDCDNGIDDNCNGVVDADCLTPCELAEMTRSSVGCVYYAVDANNDPVEGYDAMQYAVVVSNTDPKKAANVEAQVRSGNVWQKKDSATVLPGTLKIFNLPDRHINYTGLLVAGAYRIVSDLPVIAYQFQPIDGQTSYTSDASLLLPTSSLDQYYYVVGWGKPSYGNGQLVIVGAEDGTQVTITPTVNTQAGGPIPALQAGKAFTFPMKLAAGDFIQLEGTNSFNGTYVTADKPIAVFSTHWCANIPQQQCCCDHLEEQLFGLQTWGKTYAASRLPVRKQGTPEPTQWHILASEDNTKISFQAAPPVTGLPPSPQTLNKGKVLFLEVSGTALDPGDFVVKADKPVLVMEYMSSSAFTGMPAPQAGDPCMTQSVPVEQFLSSYVVLVPPNWIYDFLVLTKPVGSTVKLDGNPIDGAKFRAINDGKNPPQWEVARLATPDGVHKLDGDKPFGVIVVGYDSYDSYAYPGGLNQQIINPIK